MVYYFLRGMEVGFITASHKPHLLHVSRWDMEQTKLNKCFSKMVSVFSGCCYHTDVHISDQFGVFDIKRDWSTAETDSWLAECTDSDSKWRHQQKMTAFMSEIIWLQLCTVGGSGDAHSTLFTVSDCEELMFSLFRCLWSMCEIWTELNTSPTSCHVDELWTWTSPPQHPAHAHMEAAEASAAATHLMFL